MNIFKLYYHRYLRLTPLLAITMLVSMSVFRFLGSGPLWPIATQIYAVCDRYWWSVLLYVQNYVNPFELVGTRKAVIFWLYEKFHYINIQCLGISWTLSVDMQLFILSPAIIYLIYRLRMRAHTIFISMILACIGVILAAYVKYNLKTE